MPKYLLLKHYRGGPEPHHRVPPMDEWDPEDVEAHIAFLRHVSELLEENGEYVGAQGLTPARKFVRYGGPDAAPVADRRPAPRDQRPDRGLVHDRRRVLRARAGARGLRLLRARPGRRAALRVDRDPRGDVLSVTGERLDEGALRALVPRVLAGLVRRGEDFDAAEDALQEALLEALRVWPEHPPRDPRAWLTTVATRRLIDARRSEAARQQREETTHDERAGGVPSRTRSATTPSSCSSAAATRTSRPRPRWRSRCAPSAA